jgi:hypothetical protein
MHFPTLNIYSLPMRIEMQRTMFTFYFLVITSFFNLLIVNI